MANCADLHAAAATTLGYRLGTMRRTVVRKRRIAETRLADRHSDGDKRDYQQSNCSSKVRHGTNLGIPFDTEARHTTVNSRK